MAPIKFEENIREKLQERELQPSEGAWGKLESRLGTTTQEKKKSGYFWMAVAASFVGVLLIGSWLFFGNDAKENQVANEDPIEKTIEANKSPEERNQEIITPNNNDEQQLSVSEEVEEVPVNKETTLPIRTQEKKIVEESGNTTERIALQEQKVLESKNDERGKEELEMQDAIIPQDITNEETTAVTQVEQLEETFIQQKVDEVIQQVKEIQEKNSTVSAVEIDALLAKAQRDIATNRILNSTHQKVDAQALLMDVEIELERSFRDRVFEALGDGFNKVRTAVAERNN
ncbi:hypothetical protein POV27_03930 [Aureisphaera galaxeae]|uniref:hypothetical protein n=1 Tax=Aureisphaera galaxeae TaxID=1538023 RepID=UPI002350B420|nr:hypothetical protein [Aureisphaera galaxeae]MDC8003184.1 hypothetical protein [Aureisphaera galaxeae]